MQPDRTDRRESYAERVRRELGVRCVHLLTKEAFVGLPSAHERAFELDDAIWWCDRTGEALGPDGACADRRSCHAPGRDCYEPPRRP